MFLVVNTSQTVVAQQPRHSNSSEERLTQLVEANVIAVHAKYELQMTGGRANWRGGLFNGVPAGTFIATANDSGVLFAPFGGEKDGRLRIHMLSAN